VSVTSESVFKAKGKVERSDSGLTGAVVLQGPRSVPNKNQEGKIRGPFGPFGYPMSVMLQVFVSMAEGCVCAQTEFVEQNQPSQDCLDLLQCKHKTR